MWKNSNRPLCAASFSIALTLATMTASAQAQDTKYLIGVIEQQLSNPFFARLQQAAVDEAKKNGLGTITAASSAAGDSDTQIAAVENMINRGVKGIVIDPANPFALRNVIKKARDAGIVVITTNTSLEPATTANASYETDNLAAGELVGKWAKARLGATGAKVALLDYDLSDKTSKARHDGFLKGFGLSEHSPEIVGTALTQANVETGQSSMENLLAAHSDINVVYTINEPTAQGAYLSIKRARKDIVLTSIDGSCSGVHSVADGAIGATVMQFPDRMGKMAVEAIITAVNGGAKPHGVNNSGTVLITDHPVKGLASKDSAWGLKNCWGE
ncbi:fructose transport system substrate-binding protein [Paramixta manurensis]|uniref:Fructose transport system substrate-binding protein n=1 Tax=Paramixta manurensis TaxID=2740817 RepID=A0A6M8UE60_9GAMM|nr:fructose transport system substrate-binding protein [Erwiniaceae bacterium PD-1]